MIDPVTGAALIGGAVDLAGNLFGASSASKAAAKNRHFQKHMSNTAYRRAVNDMLRAGLNPMLAFQQGGASTPGGAVADVPNFGHIGSSAVAMMQAKAATQNMIQDTRLKKENADQAEMQTDIMRAREGFVGDKPAQWEVALNKLSDEAKKARAEAGIAETQARMQQVQEQILQATAGYTINSAKSAAEVKEKEVTAQELKNILMRLDIPEAEAMAQWFETVGAGSPAAKATMSIGRWLMILFKSLSK